MPFRTLIAATDFSTEGNAAVALAYDLVERGGTVHLLHFPEAEFGEGAARIAKSAEDRLRALAPAAAQARDVRTEARAIDGPDDPVGLLEREAARVGAQAVILGSHGANKGWMRIVLGSVASGALKRLSTNVILVRPAAAAERSGA
jgi:nucleotide-binding universal stress UspA family protein